MWFKNLFRKKYTTGCIPDLLDNRDFVIESILGEEVVLPDNFIIPYYRDWFDNYYNVKPDKVSIKNQDGFGTCVSQATAGQKETEEEVELSARDLHIYCKANDNLPNIEGTYTRTGQQGLVDRGICEEKLYPEIHKPDITFEQYIDANLISVEATNNRLEHKAKSYFSVKGFDKIRQAMYENNVPIVASSLWYANDNNMKPTNYKMQLPSGNNVGGHAYRIIGWKKIADIIYLVVTNSWGKTWGDNGLFYVSKEIADARFHNSNWITIDMEKDLAKILQEYGNKSVKTIDGSKIHFISGGKKRLFSDEFIFWSNGNDFKDVVIINKEDLDLIPEGEPMSFVYDATYTTEQLKRFTALFMENQSKAKELFDKYFK